MSWLYFALISYFLAAIVAVLDKIILKRVVPRPVVYAFYVGLFGLYGFLLVPFGFSLEETIAAPAAALGSLASGFVFILFLIALYDAIRRSEVATVAPLVGVLATIFLFFLSFVFLGERLSAVQILSFIFLIAGGALVSLKSFNPRKYPLDILGRSLLAGFLMAASFALIKFAYGETAFLNAYVVGRMGEFLAAAAIFAVPAFRRRIFEHAKSVRIKSASLFVFNKILAGSYFLLQNYAFFLGSVALTQSLAGFQYLFVLIIAVFLSKKFPRLLEEEYAFGAVVKKIVAVVLIFAGLFILVFSRRPADLAPGVRNFGVTFSKIFAEQMGLEPSEVFLSALDDLGAKKLRLIAYWQEIEKSPENYDFSDLDWQMENAESRGAEVILAMGFRLPRWPECHSPPWAKDLGEKEREEKILKLLGKIVERYRSRAAIKYWQVENEPFLRTFGICPALNEKFLEKEIALVKKMDGDFLPERERRPVIVSDSGEFGFWLPAAKRADVFGTTMYRIVWSSHLPGSGYLKYPLPPDFFHLKANLIKYFAGAKPIIVVELQGEPWGPAAIYEMSSGEQRRSMDRGKFLETISYAEEVGFPDVYLWGLEWWYSEKMNGRPEIWNEAKKLFGGASGNL